MPKWTQIAVEPNQLVTWYLDEESVNSYEELCVFRAREELSESLNYYGIENVKFIIHDASIALKVGTFNFHKSYYYNSNGQLLHEGQPKHPIQFIREGNIFYKFAEKVLINPNKSRSGCMIWVWISIAIFIGLFVLSQALR